MIKVIVEKILPLGGNAEVQSSEKKILTVATNSIFDAQVDADKKEVQRLTQEVRDAHVHIHNDKAFTTSEKNATTQLKNDVITLKAQTDDIRKATDVIKNQTNTIKNDTNTIKSQTQTLKNQTQTLKDETLDLTEECRVLATKTDNDVIEVTGLKADVTQLKSDVIQLKADTTAQKTEATRQAGIATTKAAEATTQANRSKSEADRAKGIVDALANTGNIAGNLVVGGYISEGGKKLTDKYTQHAWVTSQIDTKLTNKINDLIGGAGGAFDTLKEIQTAIENNDGDINTITTALNTKLSKAGDTMTGALQINGVHTNAAPSTDQFRASGYGIIGNRAAFYMHNSLANGAVKLGVGGKYGENVKLEITSGKVTSLVNLYEGDNRVYSAGNKPTPAVLGAVNKAGDTMTGNLIIRHDNDAELRIDAGTNKNAQLYLSEDSQNHGAYIKYAGADSNNITYIGTRNGGTETNAMKISRGSNAVTFVGNPLIEAAQSTAGAAATRKDYVDGLVNGRIKVIDTHLQVGSNKWLRAASNDLGFLPASSGTVGVSFLGTSSWWFNGAYINTVNTRILNVNTMTIKQTGNIIQFLV